MGGRSGERAAWVSSLVVCGVSLSLRRAATGSTSRCYRAARPRWRLSRPQPPLVAPRRLLTSAAATTPAALSALSGLARMPRRRRFGGRKGQRAPFLDSDGVSGNQGRPSAALMCRRTQYSLLLMSKVQVAEGLGPKLRGVQRRTRRAVASPQTLAVVLKLRASSGGQFSCVRGLAWQPRFWAGRWPKGSRGWCPGTRRHAIDAPEYPAARDTPPTDA